MRLNQKGMGTTFNPIRCNLSTSLRLVIENASWAFIVDVAVECMKGSGAAVLVSVWQKNAVHFKLVGLA